MNAGVILVLLAVGGIAFYAYYSVGTAGSAAPNYSKIFAQIGASSKVNRSSTVPAVTANSAVYDSNIDY